MKILTRLEEIVQKSYFPKVENVELELKKISILRILLAIVILVRFSQITHVNYLITNSIPIEAIYTLGLMIALLVGFLVPISSILLIFSVRVFDEVMNTHTLGTSILIEFFLLLALSSVGQNYSIDRFFIEKKSLFATIVRFPYRIIGKHTKSSLTLVYFFIFSLYASISFGALGFHIVDDYWLDGLTIKSLFSNSYLCNYYASFRMIENNFPVLTSLFSITGGILQSVFQFLMLPLVFTRLGNTFVKWWGMAFFLLSLVFINLSYLPHVELLLWLGIFFPISINSKQVKILYDDHCNLCKKTMLLFKTLNFNNRIKFLAISKNQELYRNSNLSEKEVKAYMVGWYNQSLFKGYDLYIRICMVNPLLWLFLPFLLLGKIGGIGPAIYNFIAERRYHVFGTCELSFHDEIQKKDPLYRPKQNKKGLALFYIGYVVLILSFCLFKYPYLQDISQRIFPQKVLGYSNLILHKSGFEIPHVFNSVDLSMGDHWMVIYLLDKNGVSKNILPFSDLEGKRMNPSGSDFLLFSNHNSDALYFATSLRYRREILEVENKVKFHLHPSEFGYQNIERRLQYYYHTQKLHGNVEFKVDVFSNRSSKVTHWKMCGERHNPKLFLRVIYSFDGHKITNVTILESDKQMTT